MMGDLNFAAADAAQLAGQGLSSAQISQILGQTYGSGLTTSLAGTIGGVSNSLGGVPVEALTGAIKGGVGSAITGSDPLTGMLTGGAQGAISGWNPTGNKVVDNMLETGTVNAGKALLTGGDVAGAIGGSIGSALGGTVGLGQVGGMLGSQLLGNRPSKMPVRPPPSGMLSNRPQGVAPQRITSAPQAPQRIAAQPVSNQMPVNSGAPRRIGT
jgi:hypothetical protein